VVAGQPHHRHPEQDAGLARRWRPHRLYAAQPEDSGRGNAVPGPALSLVPSGRLRQLAQSHRPGQEGRWRCTGRVGHKSDPTDNPVCKAILDYVGSGKKGTVIRKQFGGARYGWPQDAIDAAWTDL
jgi:hypothetical protein